MDGPDSGRTLDLSPEGVSSECLTGGLRMTISPRDSASSSPFRTAETVLMKIRAFFVYGRMPEWFWI